VITVPLPIAHLLETTRGAHLLSEVQELLFGKWPVLLQEPLERLPFDVLEHEIGAERWVVADVEDLHDVWMVKERGRARLVLEAAQEHLAHLFVEYDVAQGLHGDRPAELRVVGEVHVPHRARPEEPVDPIAADLRGQLHDARGLVHSDEPG